MNRPTASKLDEIARAPSPWTLIDAICDDPPVDLVEAVTARFAAAGTEERRRMCFVLRGARVGGAEAALIDLLRQATGEESADILAALSGRGVRVPTELLSGPLGSASARVLEAAIGAAGCTGDDSLAPQLAGLLDRPDVRMHAAIALGRLGARSATREILVRLPSLRGLTRVGFVVALELMDDADAVEPLREWLAQAPADIAWDLHHALCHLTGREPILPLFSPDPESRAAAIRAAWAALDLSAPAQPLIEDLVARPGQAAFTLRGSSGEVVVDYDPPPPGSSWPRWDLSLKVRGRRLYAAGSRCGTCETHLRLLGWPAERIAGELRGLRDALADVRALDAELFGALHPMLAGQRAGHYVGALVDLDLERVSNPQDSWLWRRSLDDDESTPPEQLAREAALAWPGVEHFQLREPVPGSVPTFGVLLPSAPLDRLSDATVAAHAAAIASGTRPLALALAWVEERSVQGERPERFLVGVLLDGHHKLDAYARSGAPARVLLLCRLEDSWGPPEDRGRALREVIDRLVVGS